MYIPPRPATAPFCPAQVEGSVALDPGAGRLARWFRFAGPGLLVSVGYMDPGNWATDIEAGSKYGHGLLFVVLFASLAAMLLQTLCVRLGLVARKDLARACRDRYGRRTNLLLWLGAEVAIVACDLAEVLGSALALNLLVGVSIPVGIAITAFDTVLVLGLQGSGFRRIEAIVLALVTTISVCFGVELVIAGPDWRGVALGFVPNLQRLESANALYLAIGIVGATVMPHNLYLHSSVVQTRGVARTDAARREAVRFCTFDAVGSLALAFLVNAAILILAATAFHRSGHTDVAQIEDAYHLLDPVVGSSVAALIFGIALLASGQSSTITGTIAGQIVMEGFLDLRIPAWQRRLITRALALLPAFAGVWWFGDGGVGKLLVLSQVVLSFQLPFAIWPLLRFTGDRALMGDFASGRCCAGRRGGSSGWSASRTSGWSCRPSSTYNATMNDNLLLLGGTGFVGRSVCDKLVEHFGGGSARIVVPSRRPQRAKHLQLLPTLTLPAADVHDESTLVRLLHGRDAVVNLVAVLHGTEAEMHRVHVELPLKLAHACAAAGVRRLIHVSALGVEAGRELPSRYLRSKAAGEKVLAESGLDVTILRPSVIFGEHDRFLNLFASLCARFPVMPLAGADARFQPVWVQDVASAVLKCLDDPLTIGHTFECAGPTVYTLRQLVQAAGRWAGHERPVIALPAALGRLQAGAMELLPGEPMMSRDNLDSMRVANVSGGKVPGLRALGIVPAPMEVVVPAYLSPGQGLARLDRWRAGAS